MSALETILLISTGVVSVLVAFLVRYLVSLKSMNLDLSKRSHEHERKLLEAKKNADLMVKNALSEAKRLAINETREFEQLQQEKNQEIEKLEKRLQKREESLEKRLEQLDLKEKELNQKTHLLEREEEKARRTLEEAEKQLIQNQKELELVAHLSIEEARNELKKIIEVDVEKSIARDLKVMEDDLKKQAQDKAKEVIATAIQKIANEFVADVCVSVINLPSDDMKGRIIGREGRNIRAIEQATGVDLIIDDTPEAILISCFNPIRKEIAKISIERLIADGRIHPSRIEEIVEKVTSEFDQTMQEAGEKAVFEIGLAGLHQDLVMALGKLRFYTSSGQSVLLHSLETAQIAGIMAAELNLDVRLAKRAALLHDIGKSLSEDIEGHHTIVGAEFLKKCGEPKEVVEACLKHHEEDAHNLSVYTVLVQAANQLSQFRPGAKKEFLEKAIGRLKDMEESVQTFKDIEQVYVMRSGKEIRAIVSPTVMDDRAMTILAKNISKTLRKDFHQPGQQIRVTMVRELRVTEIAK